MSQVKLLRIVVASPDDVLPERDALARVFEELNGGVAKDRALRLELARWETDAYPGFHVEGPQGLIDTILRIEDCDVLIGIFWKRFGTPTHDAGSGTEHEFRKAHQAWKDKRHPQIMMYFNQRPATPSSKDEIDQWGRVLDFQHSFPKEGLWWAYKGKAQFERLVRQHLTHFLQAEHPANSLPGAGSARAETGPRSSIQNQGSGAVATGGGVAAGQGGIAIKGDVHGNITIVEPRHEAAVKGLREAYLNWLIEQVQAVPLAGVDPKNVSEESRRDLELAAVYTGLMTQTAAPRKPALRGEDVELWNLSVVEVLNREKRLALLGDPGSGKSTFVNFVALCLAGELLGRADANLAALRSPLPQDEHEARLSRGRKRQNADPQPWDHGSLLPVRVILRDFVARALTPALQSEVTGDTLWKFIVSELPEALRDFGEPLRKELLDQGGLLLLDGLDEVPEAEQRREQVKTAVEGLAATFPKLRLLVTSRTYAYQKQDWKLRRFAEAVLSPFERAQIQSFVERWYAHVGPMRGLKPEDAQGKAAALNQAIGGNPRLHELATRPLLLTLMASLHAWRGGTLPDRREQLYADAVELLLEQWESRKLRKKPDGSVETAEPSISEWLRVDRSIVRRVLNRLAYEAHRDQPELVGTADVTETRLIEELTKIGQDPDNRPARLVEYLRDRAGLLEPRGHGVYAFPHRTFQEYLAACHLTDDGFPDHLAELALKEPNRWREVTLLAAAKAGRGTAAAIWTLAETLCEKPMPSAKEAAERGYWGALLAAQALVENQCLAQVAPRNREKLERIRQWLVRTLEDGALLPVDRAQAGDALATLGDSRFQADAWFLPDEPLLGFVEVEAGDFLMGSDRKKDGDAFDHEIPQHTLNLPSYYISKYLVTVGQYQAFVSESGHKPEDADSLKGLFNHPVVNITWYEALKYCHWLTERLQGWKRTPEPLAELIRKQGWQVMLPSEAEWEKAARGSDGRIYPWEGEFKSDRSNSVESGIGRTTAVGSFPSGASPWRCLDMAGNVWEWTRSLWGKDVSQPEFRYPYTDERERRENLKASRDVRRVLRGGSFFNYRQDVRCAYRDWGSPDLRGNDIGFRVVVLPSSYSGL